MYHPVRAQQYTEKQYAPAQKKHKQNAAVPPTVCSNDQQPANKLSKTRAHQKTKSNRTDERPAPQYLDAAKTHMNRSPCTSSKHPPGDTNRLSTQPLQKQQDAEMTIQSRRGTITFKTQAFKHRHGPHILQAVPPSNRAKTGTKLLSSSDN
ncbi:hypothetical protein Nepgr_009386 [Nepenthes gracilis]|uniref:Uncharacterized protein n=1 Tax=Nepenthes gracilis TaxID=150966 RepID=A0AAD3XKC0_NEPGR|nr:hypothetical protein Nepgr_009386 [Nepenthes gracilis]